jgi:hypothetical protein
MPPYMVIHPVFGILAVALILTAFFMKVGPHKFWELHYWTGTAAFGFGWLALGLAILAIMRRMAETQGAMGLPLVLLIHFMLATLGLLVLIIQFGLGLAMRFVIGGPPRFYKYHKLNARILAGMAALIFIFGLLSLGMASLGYM